MAEQFTVPIHVGGGATMFIPNPKHDPHIEWSLRYSRDLNDPQAGRFSAAAVVESYAYLLSKSITMGEAVRRLRLLRWAAQAHAAAIPPEGGERKGCHPLREASSDCAYCHGHCPSPEGCERAERLAAGRGGTDGR